MAGLKIKGKWSGDRKLIKEKIIAVGNPGSGKSTLLNYLAGKINFHSGVSFGQGMTYQLDESFDVDGGVLYCDTPGLADDTLRKEAADAISQALQEGGPSKVIFFVTQQMGRVVTQDVTTIKMVLSAAPEIKDRYAIIVNQIDGAILKRMTEDKEKQNIFITKLFGGIMGDDSQIKDTGKIFFVERKDELTAQDDVLATDGSIKGLKEFVTSKVPIINLTPNNNIKVNANEFEMIQKQVEIMVAELGRNKELSEARFKALENSKNNEIWELAKIASTTLLPIAATGIIDGIKAIKNKDTVS